MQRTYQLTEIAPTRAQGRLADLLLREGVACHFPVGALIQQKGDAGDGFWLVASGTVSLCRFAADGDVTVFGVLGAGDLFGELAYFAGTRRQVDAVADEASRLVRIGPALIERLLASEPEFARWLLKSLSNQLRAAIDQIDGERQLSAEQGMTFIPPFDHAHVLCGQGTAALELFEEVGELDHLFVCLGGGGLLSGSALSARALSPHCKVYGVEPEAGNDVQQSFRSGQRVRIPTPVTIADGAQTPLVGELTFELIRRHVDNILTATDAQLVQAMRFYAERMKMVVEPTGCLSLAAACHAGVSLKGQRVGVLISGGNVDLQRFAELLQQNSTQA